MKPLVGITAIPRNEVSEIARVPHATLNESFAGLCDDAGGVPVVLLAVDDVDALAERLDAIVLSGGGDVLPQEYGAELHPKTTWTDARRDAFELALVRAARARSVPVLGVCRGMQVLNVALGGSLVQHLPELTELAHEVPERWNTTAHPIEIEPGSRLHRLLGAESVEVSSVHHQAIERLADGLRAVAWAPDGVVEAVESPTEPVLGVQWHPEWATGTDRERQLALFTDLVVAARGTGGLRR